MQLVSQITFPLNVVSTFTVLQTPNTLLPCHLITIVATEPLITHITHFKIVE